MDYDRWTEVLQNPQNPLPPIDVRTEIYTPHYQYYSHHPQNPNPNPNLGQLLPQTALKPLHEFYAAGLDTGLTPSGTDSYASMSSYPPSQEGYQALPGVAYGHQTVETEPSAYYHDPNLGTCAAEEPVRQYEANPVGYAAGITIPPNGTEQLVTAYSNATLWMTQTVRPCGNGTWRRVPKKTKIVQSAWCEVCKIDCNSKDVLEKHKLGKKHKKNLEKLNEVNSHAPNASAGSENPVIGPVDGQKSRKKVTEPVEDLETKRRKIVEGGAAAGAVRVCALCNVVCNSQTVFNYHLAGQKHSSMLKKHAAGTAVAAAT